MASDWPGVRTTGRAERIGRDRPSQRRPGHELALEQRVGDDHRVAGAA